jgi:hypothetical protein
MIVIASSLFFNTVPFFTTLVIFAKSVTLKSLWFFICLINVSLLNSSKSLSLFKVFLTSSGNFAMGKNFLFEFALLEDYCLTLASQPVNTDLLLINLLNNILPIVLSTPR